MTVIECVDLCLQVSIDLPDAQTSSSSAHSNKSNTSQQSGIEDFVMVDFVSIMLFAIMQCLVGQTNRQKGKKPGINVFLKRVGCRHREGKKRKEESSL